MQVHAAKGNQADLVRQYEICKDALMSELGVVPSPQTEALYLDLLAE
jgi:DNA-binding SARP family transcriptional activator